ncbi:MAG: dATP/dGTP diphosphohydrolase domain-containing protein, partial [Dokdonella sp.]
MSEIIYTKETGIKEIENKVSYSEIYWSFIEQMAIRMNDNKEKYGTHNYRKPLQNKDELLDAAIRHLIKIIEPNKEDK